MKQYKNPMAFKQALEQRLRNSPGSHIARQRQLVVFDRFLARLTLVLGDAVILKGGLALELRLERARTTKDIDLRVSGPPDVILEQLRAAGRIDLRDFMRFEVQPDPRHPTIQNEGVRYEGQRFRVECTLAGKIYGSSFGVDVAQGDPVLGDPDILTAADHLGFAGIAPPTLHVYPIQTHIAEKLHAYTMPRERPNSRVKDLPDLALLASASSLCALDLHDALHKTFSFRQTHQLPDHVPAAPASWEAPYRNLVQSHALPWTTLDEVLGVTTSFLEPVLKGLKDGNWNPSAWAWEP